MEKRTRKYLLLALIVAFIAITFAVINQNNFVLKIDSDVQMIVLNTQSPALNNLALAITKVGDSPEIIFIFAIFAILLLLKRKKYSLYEMTAAVVSGTIFTKIIKLLVERARPGSDLLLEPDFSFPSGHSTMSMILLLSSIFLIAPNIKDRCSRIIFITTTSVIFPLVALSRIYLSVHWVSDVIASLILGSICFLSVKMIISKSDGIAE